MRAHLATTLDTRAQSCLVNHLSMGEQNIKAIMDRIQSFYGLPRFAIDAIQSGSLPYGEENFTSLLFFTEWLVKMF